MTGRCEDYPCCGHTDGLPCDYVYVPGPHDGCDHNTGFCEAEDDDDQDLLDAIAEDYYDNSDRYDKEYDLP